MSVLNVKDPCLRTIVKNGQHRPRIGGLAPIGYLGSGRESKKALGLGTFVWTREPGEVIAGHSIRSRSN